VGTADDEFLSLRTGFGLSKWVIVAENSAGRNPGAAGNRSYVLMNGEITTLTV
jgi:hypothetical protein